MREYDEDISERSRRKREYEYDYGPMPRPGDFIGRHDAHAVPPRLDALDLYLTGQRTHSSNCREEACVPGRPARNQPIVTAQPPLVKRYDNQALPVGMSHVVEAAAEVARNARRDVNIEFQGCDFGKVVSGAGSTRLDPSAPFRSFGSSIAPTGALPLPPFYPTGRPSEAGASSDTNPWRTRTRSRAKSRGEESQWSLGDVFLWIAEVVFALGVFSLFLGMII